MNTKPQMNDKKKITEKPPDKSFDPKPTEYPFGEYTDTHYLVVKKNDGTVFDEAYPYVDRSLRARALTALVRILLVILVFPVMRVRLGLKICGRKNLRKHRKELKDGALSCSNHVHLWDYLAVDRAIFPFVPNVLVWAPNIRGENGRMMRSVGGIPVPEGSPKATSAMLSAVRALIERGGWLHIYPEGSMWEYYRPVRPFKRGVAYFSCLTGRPVVPIGFSYRRPGWIRRTVFRQKALFTVEIGEPLLPDASLPRRERETDLLKRCHAAVCGLCGIDPSEDIYPPVFDRTRRVDYY